MGSAAATDGRSPLIVLAICGAILVIALALGAARPKERLAGSNGVPDPEFVAVVKPGQALCQREARLPAGAGSLRMTIGTYGRTGPPLRTSVQSIDGTRLLADGRLAAGWTQGSVDLPLGATTRKRRSPVRICVSNPSRVRIAVAGTPVGRGALPARVAGKRERGRVRFEYVLARRTSTWSLADRIASRMTFGRGLWGGLAPWLVVILVVLACGGAIRALLSSGKGT